MHRNNRNDAAKKNRCNKADIEPIADNGYIIIH
jgi:hypothetical protein